MFPSVRRASPSPHFQQAQAACFLTLANAPRVGVARSKNPPATLAQAQRSHSPLRRKKSKAAKEKTVTFGPLGYPRGFLSTHDRYRYISDLAHFLSNRPDNGRRLYVKGNFKRHKRIPRELLLLIFVIG